MTNSGDSPGASSATEQRDPPTLGGPADGHDDYRRVVEHTASHAVFMLTPDGRISFWPTPAERLYGYEEGEAVGRSIHSLFAGADASELADLLDDARRGGVQVEHRHERADGSVFWAACSLSPVSNGRVEGYTVVTENVTSRKRYERMLERQNERRKEFTDALAHDLRNPLTVISGRLDLYRVTGDQEHVEKVIETTARMERLLDDLLEVARHGNVVEDPKPVALGAIVETAWEGFASETATLQCETVPKLRADPDRLCELFENLFRNCIEHGQSDEASGANDGRADGIGIRVGPLPDGFYVEDDGRGVPEEIRPDVFDHGFTTDDDGTGYGLSIVRTIARAHDWDVAVTESDAGGARVEITGAEFVAQ
jgi:PAS domain S-box-containing protein